MAQPCSSHRRPPLDFIVIPADFDINNDDDEHEYNDDDDQEMSECGDDDENSLQRELQNCRDNDGDNDNDGEDNGARPAAAATPSYYCHRTSSSSSPRLSHLQKDLLIQQSASLPNLRRRSATGSAATSAASPALLPTRASRWSQELPRSAMTSPRAVDQLLCSPRPGGKRCYSSSSSSKQIHHPHQQLPPMPCKAGSDHGTTRSSSTSKSSNAAVRTHASALLLGSSCHQYSTSNHSFTSSLVPTVGGDSLPRIRSRSDMMPRKPRRSESTADRNGQHNAVFPTKETAGANANSSSTSPTTTTTTTTTTSYYQKYMAKRMEQQFRPAPPLRLPSIGKGSTASGSSQLKSLSVLSSAVGGETNMTFQKSMTSCGRDTPPALPSRQHNNNDNSNNKCQQRQQQKHHHESMTLVAASTQHHLAAASKPTTTTTKTPLSPSTSKRDDNTSTTLSVVDEVLELLK